LKRTFRVAIPTQLRSYTGGAARVTVAVAADPPRLADIFAGLEVAYAALQKAYAKAPRTKLGGFTPEQRFFLGWARVWRNLQTDEDLRTQVQTDGHSPAKWRINGPMSNMPEFREAWGCKDGDPMARPEDVRAKIW